MLERVGIERIAAGGDGVGRLADGRVVFVPRTAPGDVVTLKDLRPSRRFARARLDRVLEPGPERIEPRCPHYTTDSCGGCQLQHLTTRAQLTARRSVVGDALRRLGRLDVSDPEIEPAEQQFGYRAKLTLAVSPDARRIGLHPLGPGQDVFELARCHITADSLMELWSVLRDLKQLLAPGLDRLVLRLDRSGGRHVVAQVAGSVVWTRAAELAVELGRRKQPATLWWHPEGGAARVVAGPRGSAGPPASVFEQVHPAMGDRVRRFAVSRLGPVAGQRVWDLYAGIGETTALLVEAGAQVESVERDARAVAHAASTGVSALRHAGLAETIVPRLGQADVVVTNPPRNGMDPIVSAAVAASAARRVVYVSCDPATLARDIAALAPRFALAEVRTFDMFPQTAHVETVAVLDRV
jgi:23S rRNA (uracil1939-C5)-methyltransferase